MFKGPIKNEPTQHLDDPTIQSMRGMFEHRATWFYLILDEMVKAGVDMDTARAAIYRCGCIHGREKYPRTDDLTEFCEAFMPEHIQKILEVDIVKCTKDELDLDFHYCPLVAAWQKLTDDQEKIKHLCDIAMDGDRGVVSEYPNWEFELGDTIADGCPTCQIHIRKK